VRELLADGMLTPYQAGQVLAGRGRRLRLGPYRVLDRLGGGGMGQVYKAEHILLRRLVALKIVARLPRREAGGATPRPGEPTRRELVSRFRREALAAGRMHHPNVLTTYDAGVARGLLFLVMEYVEGADLGRCVAAHGPLPVPLACEAIRQAALALQYAHDRGLVHRDIKPENLLLTWPGAPLSLGVGSLPSLPDGTSGEGEALIKLLDLGLALPTRLAAGRPEPAGTPDFMAPELAQRQGPVDGRSDLYGLGCTFYYLLAGRVPYPGGSSAEKLLRHQLDQPAAVRGLRPEVSPAIAAVVERLMSKDPAQRFPGPSAVASVLRELAEQGWGPAWPEAELLSPGTLPTTPSAPSLPEITPTPPHVAPASRRIRLPRPRAVAAAAVVGPVLALAAVGLPSPAPRLAMQRAAARPGLPFRLESTGGEFVNLAEALAAAIDGDTVTVRAAGTYRLPPTDLGDKALTLRAACKERPRIEPREPAADGPWQALLATRRSLTLQALELATAGDAPLVSGTGAALSLTDCRLAASGGGPAVVSRGGTLLVRSCRVRSAATAVAVEADGACAVELTDSAIAADPAGAAVALWAPESSRPAYVHLQLVRNAIVAGRMASVRALAGRLRIEASDNDFTFREALASFSGYADDAAWRRATTWAGGGNVCHTAGYWLRVDGRPADVSDPAAWQRLWAEAPTADAVQAASASPAALR
jgi:serine/threonine-protein kinase